jgi:hypothetical protein
MEKRRGEFRGIGPWIGLLVSVSYFFDSFIYFSIENNKNLL